ncbi:MAG: M42 family peptidase [Archaeoglobales archaeon]|nr:MAG: M42 family peptidase [Archaeoglobales archaeon]
MFELLKRLSDAHGISGYEDEIREIVKSELEDYVDEIRVDKLGNLICVKNGGEFEVMVCAHMDEIGFMVKHIDEKGFIRFAPIGGWFSQIALGQRVVLHGSKKVYGVVGCKPPHVMKDEERKKAVEIKDMFIDVGAESRDEVVEMGIDVGTPITIDRELVKMGKRVTGKALDDRVGLAVMIDSLKQTESDATIYVVGTVQEEVGLKGARVSAFAIEPDVALALDVCVATDFPGTESLHMDIKLGKGPVITIVDASGRGLIATKDVVRWLKETAERNDIPYQLEVAEGGTTDATAIQITKSGVPSGVVSIPARYIHSPVEVVDLRDLENSSKLISRALERVERYF